MAPKPPQRRLGRGLSSLISTDLSQTTQAPATPGQAASIPPGELRRDVPSAATEGKSGTGLPYRLASIPLDSIRTNPLQPRKVFDDTRLQELAASIRQSGNLQPIVVRVAEGGYELIAGERRLRASRLAGLTEIPAIIRMVSDEHMLELALIENIQRADLNPVERASGYRLLVEKYHLTHEQVAERVGEDRATITNFIRLLQLSDAALERLATGELSTGHAKVLLGIPDAAVRDALTERVIAEGWSVRRLETEAQATKVAPVARSTAPARRPAVTDLEDRLKAALGLRVAIHEGRRPQSGKVVIEYHSLDDFERIILRLGVESEDVA